MSAKKAREKSYSIISKLALHNSGDPEWQLTPSRYKWLKEELAMAISHEADSAEEEALDEIRKVHKEE